MSVSEVRYLPYNPDESQLDDMMALFEQHLSEPYNIYTYRIFTTTFPKLAHVAVDKHNCIIGAICGKVDQRKHGYRGYIAMVAVDPDFRHRGIAGELVRRSIQGMRDEGATEVCLETECSNTAALSFYDGLGFVVTKHLRAYYLSGNSAFRLKKALI
ncbi:Acetyltransferase (GNAT) family [Carpediemonas membranifera]|uniref:Acetyltransferase (GNAT) family n=1 Tax=Carpediemonas membranifera TaxID=201153 RepID=A0A8J6BAQ3_9EUKA|nr:Acetyltransferase (GNAT) family [Carpediemonas membranifera]|eukprot:KAG9393447.1 Acetyltransferase (GNAT) family [Carpediemonas membranifera]